MKRMLKPDKDRLDYSNILIPPVDYVTEMAVGTTYSLDLETLLGISLALSLAQSMDGQVSSNGLQVLEAIRKSSDKITVFCQSGKIAVPAEKRSIFSLLESSVYQVLPKGENSFHPKVWVLKYRSLKDEEDIKYRVIVLSRNLTFDRSWDIAVSLEGAPANEESEVNRPLADFLNYLSGYVTDSKRRKNIRSLASELLFASFELGCREFSGFGFYPLGIPGYTMDDTGLFKDTYHSLAVISPFLSKSRVEMLEQKRLSNADMILVSRKSELCKLGKDLVDRLECWHMKESVVDGESTFEEENGIICKQDIHAKVYLKTKYSTSELWLGSTNCSNKGFSGNIEFMLNLIGPSRYCNLKNLRSDLFGDEERTNPFERFTSDRIMDIEGDSLDDLLMEKLIREICRAKSKADVVFDSSCKDTFNISLYFEKLPEIPEGVSVQVYPLLCQNKATALGRQMLFEGLKLTELGAFFVIRVSIDGESTKEAVLKVATSGIPEARDSEIFKSIIKNEEGFIQYIAFLLGDDFLLTSLEQAFDGGCSKFKFLGSGYQKPVLYEKMLKAASRSPERLQDIKRVMELIQEADSNIVPSEFKQLYDKFDKTICKVWRIKA